MQCSNEMHKVTKTYGILKLYQNSFSLFLLDDPGCCMDYHLYLPVSNQYRKIF